MSLFDNIGGPVGSFLGNAVGGFFEEVNLKDYAHASKLMVTDGHALAPNQKFLFHVYFNLEFPAASGSNDAGLVGALVKTVQLPSYDVETEEYIQYNRKRLVHNKIKYKPVTIKLHDDSSDTVRSMWYNYYNYHFSDPSYTYDGGATGKKENEPKGKGIGYWGRDIYNRNHAIQDWGFTTDSPNGSVKRPFFKDIKIYGMSRGNFILYTLINPVITSWEHDTYDYSAAGGTMEHTMNVQYEAVKYSKGKIGKNGSPILGFADPSRYDTTPGALGGKGAIASFNDSFGILDAGQDILTDLASGDPKRILGGIQRAGRSIVSLKNSKQSLGQILTRDLSLLAETEISNAIRKYPFSQGPKTAFPKANDGNTQGDKNNRGKPYGPARDVDSTVDDGI